MDEIEFKQQFVVVFLATWTAKNYDHACAMGQHERLNNPPVEDATSLAEDTWRKVCQDQDACAVFGQ